MSTINGDSPEAVAFALLEKIAQVEGKVFQSEPARGYSAVDRRWILETYTECLDVVLGRARNNPHRISADAAAEEVVQFHRPAETANMSEPP